MKVNGPAMMHEMHVDPPVTMITIVERCLSTSVTGEFVVDLAAVTFALFQVDVCAEVHTKPESDLSDLMIAEVEPNSLGVATSCLDANLLVAVIMGFDLHDCTVWTAGVWVKPVKVVGLRAEESPPDVIIEEDDADLPVAVVVKF